MKSARPVNMEPPTFLIHGMQVSLSPEETSVLLHTLGIEDPRHREMYRNHYVVSEAGSPGPAIEGLVAKGLMQQGRTPRFIDPQDRVFHATAAGIPLARRLQPAPPRRSPAAERFHRFSALREVCPDLTFHQFLTSRVHRELRDVRLSFEEACRRFADPEIDLDLSPEAQA